MLIKDRSLAWSFLTFASACFALYYGKQQRQNLVRVAKQFNFTWSKICDPNFLFFNRTPKTGSQTIRNMLAELSKQNNFTQSEFVRHNSTWTLALKVQGPAKDCYACFF